MSVLPEITASLSQQLAAIREGAAARALDALAFIEAHGADRASWLNGLVTQDTRTLAPGAAIYGAAVAVKGRLLADLHVYARPESLLLAIPSERLDALCAHLERFIVMEDVTLSTPSVRAVALVGPRAARLDGFGCYETERLGCKGIDVIVDDRDEAAARSNFAQRVDARELVVVGEEAWEVARVRAGVPRFGVDFDTTNFIQEAAITPKAVSFNKGCYLGQEVVCRLEMRGHVQRHLLRLEVDGLVPAVGDAVQCDGAQVGVVTSAAPGEGGAGVAIAMVRYAAVDGALVLGGQPARAQRIFSP